MVHKVHKFDAEARQKLLTGAAIVEQAVGATLGPRGNNAAIDRKFGAPLVLQDGVSVAREVTPLADPFENLGASLVIEASERTNRVGDGTTGTVILTHALVKEAYKQIAAGANAMMLRRGMEKARDIIIERLDKLAKPLKKHEDIVALATISAQNAGIGELVANAIKKLGKEAVITVEESNATETTVEYKEGMQFDSGYLSTHFITNGETRESDIEQPYILVTDKKIVALSDIAPIVHALHEAKNPRLVVIADSVESDALAFLVINKVKGAIHTVAIAAPGVGERKRHNLEDIAIMTGAKFLSTEAGYNLEHITIDDLGRAKRIVTGPDSTIIVGGEGDPETIQEHVTALKTTMQHPDTKAFDKERLEERIAKMTSGIAIIHVGAATETEMREKKERVIDAISATKAALDRGVVAGGETALLRSSRDITREMKDESDEVVNGAKIVEMAAQRPFERLMLNSGLNAGEKLGKVVESKYPMGVDVIDGQLKDLTVGGVLDPVRVVQAIVENAVSTAVMMMTTSVLITEEEYETQNAA